MKLPTENVIYFTIVPIVYNNVCLVAVTVFSRFAESNFFFKATEQFLLNLHALCPAAQNIQTLALWGLDILNCDFSFLLISMTFAEIVVPVPMHKFVKFE